MFTNDNCHNCLQITNTNTSAFSAPLREINPVNPVNPVKNQYWLDAYAQIKDTLTKPHEGRIKENWDIYDKYGYYPCDIVKGESVSRTLECGYDDWCAAVMAEKMGEWVTAAAKAMAVESGNGELDKRLKADAEFFFKRAESWRKVFDSSIGFMRGGELVFEMGASNVDVDGSLCQ